MNDEIKVWDPLVRLFHWSLVVAFTLSYITEDDWESVHVWAGYTVTGLVAFRILWGVVGPEYARFSNFIYSRTIIFAYLKDMLSLREKRYLGHNPAGGMMVLALLGSLALTTLSGMKVYAVEKNAGPFAAIEVNLSPITMAQADSDEEDEGHDRRGHGEGGEFWEEIHEFFANLTLLLVVLHIGGVIFSSFSHNENLPRAMVTGKKRREL